jgi:hypothetical protein
MLQARSPRYPNLTLPALGVRFRHGTARVTRAQAEQLADVDPALRITVHEVRNPKPRITLPTGRPRPPAT